MSQLRTVYQWCQVIRKQMPVLSKPQAYNLAAFSVGLGLARRCTLTHVAEKLWFLGKPDSIERRLQRWVGNTRITGAACSAALTSWALRSLVPGTAILLVDETSLQDKMKVMVVSLAYRGRALPLAWWCYHQEQWPMGQVDLIKTLLGWIAKGVPPGRRVLVEADRGIGNSPRLLQGIEALGWHYLVRVTGQVHLRLEDGQEREFKKLAPSPGSVWAGPVHAFKTAGWVSCWAVAIWGLCAKEPWLLITNDPNARGPTYGLRMWEEEAFKDMKSNGWQWQRSHVWDPQHANRLWLVMALAYLWVVSLGTQVLLTPRLLQTLTRGRKIRLSVYHLGLRHFHRLLATHRIPSCRLRLIPCEKTVV